MKQNFRNNTSTPAPKAKIISYGNDFNFVKKFQTLLPPNSLRIYARIYKQLRPISALWSLKSQSRTRMHTGSGPVLEICKILHIVFRKSLPKFVYSSKKWTYCFKKSSFNLYNQFWKQNLPENINIGRFVESIGQPWTKRLRRCLIVHVVCSNK